MNFEDLSPELKEKAKACKTPEEILALAKEEGYTLSEEELDGLAGGGPEWNCSYTCENKEYDTTCWTLQGACRSILRSACDQSLDFAVRD